MRPQDIFDRIVASHQTIREILATAHTEEAEVLAVEMARLDPLLEDHFAFEEQLGGFHDRIAQADPEAARALLAAHRKLLHEYVHMIHALQEGHPDGRALARAFARQLEEHERQESVWASLEVRR